jgi:hypothetical protein
MILIVLLIALVGSLALLKYLGSLAMRPTEIEVGDLTLDQIVELGTRSSHGRLRRMFGKPTANRTADGGAEWTIRTGAGVMGVRVSPTPIGYRVVAQALTMRIAQHQGWINLDTTWGRSKLLTNWLFAALGIPHNPRKLLSQRKRVFRAITKAAANAAVPAAVQVPAPGRTLGGSQQAQAPQGTSGS